jgi:hypothetical protein
MYVLRFFLFVWRGWGGFATNERFLWTLAFGSPPRDWILILVILKQDNKESKQALLIFFSPPTFKWFLQS